MKQVDPAGNRVWNKRIDQLSWRWTWLEIDGIRSKMKSSRIQEPSRLNCKCLKQPKLGGRRQQEKWMDFDRDLFVAPDQ